MAQASKLKTVTPAAPAKQKTPTVEERVATIVATISKIKIETAADCVKASEHFREAAVLRRDIEKTYKAKREPLLKQQREIIADEKKLTTALDAAEKSVTALISEFQKKEAAERAAKEQAEREKREQQARDEAKLRADQLRVAAQNAQSKAVARRLEAQANVVEHAQPIIDPIPVEEAPQTLAPGVSKRKLVHAAVQDLKALVLQIAAGIMLKEYAGAADPVMAAYLNTFGPDSQATMNLLQPSMPALHALAQNFPDDLALRGVYVEEDESFTGRSR